MSESSHEPEWYQHQERVVGALVSLDIALRTAGKKTSIVTRYLGNVRRIEAQVRKWLFEALQRVAYFQQMLTKLEDLVSMRDRYR